ncbi:MAG TPA: hypothetical protein PKN14_10235 [Bacteroidia bacterium]|nr:hypothetical protein [Bacteroidia bacterium]HNR49612.1 hypothetical protein [Bacteroidia bacterium]HNT83120.1 hypothetical protein [Bacteroidia bacterium]
MNKKIYLLAGTFLVMAFSSCYYDVEDELYPSTSCDTTNVTYSESVAPVLKNYCYSCHSAAIANGSVVLDNYQSVKHVAADGRLLGTINHESGYIAMPQDQKKLSNCDIRKITIWINDGMQDN